ncbi:MAG: hypothetical protein ACXVCP_16745 [Bdellovibrio sp.]
MSNIGLRNFSAFFTILILFSPATFADHDDGDDVQDYNYVLQFDPKDLAKFNGFILKTPSMKEFDENLEVEESIGALRDPDSKTKTDLKLGWANDVPMTIWAIPSPTLTDKIKKWIRSKAKIEFSSDGQHQWTSASEENLEAFSKTFKASVTEISYYRSPVLQKMLGLGKCGLHFLKPTGAALSKIIEKVKIVGSSGEKQLVPVQYTFEYDGFPSVEISPDQARKMSGTDFQKLLNKQVSSSISNEDVANETNGIQVTHTQKYEIPNKSEPILHIDWLWLYGGPTIGGIGLLALFFRKRRSGK